MTNSYHNIYILGGHKLAYSYYEQIQTAQKNNLITFKNIYLIDPDPNCYALSHSRTVAQSQSHILKSYNDFIQDYIENTSEQHKDDILVPDHTAKHVMLQVFLDVVKKKYPEFKTELSPFESDFKTPFLHKMEDGAIWAISYATWTCPADCDEPEVCPHIEDKRTWDFEKSLSELFKKLSDTDFATLRLCDEAKKDTVAQSHSRKVAQSTLSLHRFPCQAFVGQISHIPFTKIKNEIEIFLEKIKTTPPEKVIIATHSHCHGILGQFKLLPKHKGQEV